MPEERHLLACGQNREAAFCCNVPHWTLWAPACPLSQAGRLVAPSCWVSDSGFRMEIMTHFHVSLGRGRGRPHDERERLRHCSASPATIVGRPAGFLLQMVLFLLSLSPPKVWVHLPACCFSAIQHTAAKLMPIHVYFYRITLLKRPRWFIPPQHISECFLVPSLTS